MYFFFQAEDGIRYLVRSRGLGDVYKRQQYQSAGGLVIKTDVNFNLDLNFKSHANTAGWGKYLSLIHI